VHEAFQVKTEVNALIHDTKARLRYWSKGTRCCKI